MVRNFKTLLAAGCIGVLALSAPAQSRPAPHGEQAQGAQKKSAAAKKIQANKRNAKKRAQAHQQFSLPAPARGELPPVRVNAAMASFAHARPAFGWPSLVVEARKYMGTNPTARKRLWCATFMNMVLAKTGYSGTGSDAAKSFASYGKRITEPKVGAIAVLTRGKRGGHVGIVTGIDVAGNPIIISGNHNKRVGEATYNRKRVIAYVMPAGRTLVAQAGATRASDAGESGFTSPIAELLAAINAERPASERGRPEAQPTRVAQPAVAQVSQPVPQRLVQQTPSVTPPSPEGRRALPLSPGLADFLGIRDRDRDRPLPLPRAQQQSSSRVAATPPNRVERVMLVR